jgi:hypothetical protein
MRSLSLLGLALSACNGTGNKDEAGPDPQPPELPVVNDTGWPPGDLANIHIAHNVNTGQTEAYAVFVESAPVFTNLAQCAVRGGTCFGGFAQDEDEFEDYDPDQDLEQEGISTRFAGFELKVGPYTLPYREDPDSKFGYYFSPGTDIEPPFDETIGVSWAGQWIPYEGTDDFYVPNPIELLAPPAGSNIFFTNGEKVPFEWVPTGQGLVTLSVSTRFTMARLYTVEDDGYFELDVDDLGLISESDELTFKLTRWNSTTLRKYGHVVELLATSEATFTGDYVQIGSRIPIQAADECPQAQGSLPLEAGGWWGYLGGELNADSDPPASCIGSYPADARGPDGIFRINIDPKHAFSVDYNLFDASGTLYMVEDCNDVNDTCLIGRDESPDPGGHEFVQIFNPNDDPQIVYLVIDATDSNETSVFTLDVTDEELLPPPMYDTCAAAQLAAQDPVNPVTIGSGNYYADFTSYLDHLNPGEGGCTGSSLTGADSLVAIQLQSGQTLNAGLTMPGGDGALYLLYNCNDEFSCPIGADAGGISALENLQYTNYSAGVENMYLVVDSKGAGMRPYFLAITIQ